jgi:hypothetical protein
MNYIYIFILLDFVLFFFFYQKSRFERLNSFTHHPGNESDNYVGSSAATTVVRKTVHSTSSTGKSPPTTPNSFEGITRSNLLESNHKVLTNTHALEQHQYRASMRQTTTKNQQESFLNSYSGQQILLTSGDIEAMTLKQFRIGSLGC